MSAPEPCHTPSCPGDGRYTSPGRGHLNTCRNPWESAPESLPLSEQEKSALTAGLNEDHDLWRDGSTDLYSTVFRDSAVERILASRTAALLDRLKAAEGERDYWRTSAERCLAELRELREVRRERDDLRARYETAEADKARAVAEARSEVLAEVESAVIEAAPGINSELRYDGREDPVAASYVAGFRDAWEAVHSHREEEASGS